MTYLGTKEFLIEVVKGAVAGHSISHNFGRNPSVGTSYVPVTIGGVWRTPQVAGATTLRVKAGGNANDTANGSGAREVTIEGINQAGAAVTETLATAGTSASSTTTATFIRINRCYVSRSGTYATSSAGSHAGDITIEKGAGSEDWATITTDSGSWPRGEAEIGAYCIPTAYSGYILRAHGFTDTSKVTEIVFFRREGVLETSAPYTGMLQLFEERAEGGALDYEPSSPLKISGPADVGFLAKVGAGTGEVHVDFEVMLVAD